MSCTRFSPRSRAAQALGTIRIRWKIEPLAVKSEEDSLSEESKAANAAQVTQVLYQTMYGPVSNVGAADRISQTMIVCPTDLRALKFHLRGNGFQGPDLEELEKAIKADETGPKLTEHHFGKNVADWLATIVRKAANGALKIGADVAVTVATKALGSYYSIG